jgi:hypothetical protein
MFPSSSVVCEDCDRLTGKLATRHIAGVSRKVAQQTAVHLRPPASQHCCCAANPSGSVGFTRGTTGSPQLEKVQISSRCLRRYWVPPQDGMGRPLGTLTHRMVWMVSGTVVRPTHGTINKPTRHGHEVLVVAIPRVLPPSLCHTC